MNTSFGTRLRESTQKVEGLKSKTRELEHEHQCKHEEVE